MKRKLVTFENLSLGLQIFLLITYLGLVFVFFIVLGAVMENGIVHKSDLKDLPHKICVNETIWIEYNKTNFVGYIYYDECLVNNETNKSKCFMKTEKEICKWEGLE